MAGAAASRPPASKGKTGPPDATEWQRWLEYGLTLLTAFYTDAMVRGIDDWTPVEQAEVDKLNGEFIQEFSTPLANILTRNTFARKYGRQVVDSYDWLAIIIAGWGYHRDLADVRDRRRDYIAKKQAELQRPRVMGAPANVQANEEPAPSDGIGYPGGLSIPWGAAAE